jgi:hypothetical protein
MFMALIIIVILGKPQRWPVQVSQAHIGGQFRKAVQGYCQEPVAFLVRCQPSRKFASLPRSSIHDSSNLSLNLCSILDSFLFHTNSNHFQPAAAAVYGNDEAVYLPGGQAYFFIPAVIA